MKIRTIIITAVLTLSMVAGMAGCAGGNGSVSDTSSVSQVSQETVRGIQMTMTPRFYRCLIRLRSTENQLFFHLH